MHHSDDGVSSSIHVNESNLLDDSNLLEALGRNAYNQQEDTVLGRLDNHTLLFSHREEEERPSSIPKNDLRELAEAHGDGFEDEEAGNRYEDEGGNFIFGTQDQIHFDQ
jgi:hypothetical protein